MSIQNGNQASVLVEALPYMQKYHGKTIVIKYGGHAMTDDALRKSVISDIVLLTLVGIRIVVVHGGGPEISQLLSRLGIKSRFVQGLRYTDEDVMDAAQMVLCGKVNKDLVALINRAGGRAIGLCGLDGNLLQAVKYTDGDADYGLVGDVCKTDPQIVFDALEAGYIPVISTVAQGVDADTAYNVNADTAAAKLAAALGAEKLILLTDVPGLLQNPKDESSLIPVIRLSEIPALLENGTISGGMIPKIECMAEAIRGGVPRANLQDGRMAHSVLIELFSDSGVGTMLIL